MYADCCAYLPNHTHDTKHDSIYSFLSGNSQTSCWFYFCCTYGFILAKSIESKWLIGLTYLGRVAHISVNKLITIGSDNGLLLSRRQNSDGTLLIVPLGTKCSEILTTIYTFSLEICIWKFYLENGRNFVSVSICLSAHVCVYMCEHGLPEVSLSELASVPVPYMSRFSFF